MSEELFAPSTGPDPAEALPDDWEEISSDEVDRVVAALDQLIESVQSENIRMFLSEASDSIFGLVYDDDSFSDSHDEAA
jgi:hypothetical protein